MNLQALAITYVAAGLLLILPCFMLLRDWHPSRGIVATGFVSAGLVAATWTAALVGIGMLAASAQGHATRWAESAWRLTLLSVLSTLLTIIAALVLTIIGALGKRSVGARLYVAGAGLMSMLMLALPIIVVVVFFLVPGHF